jgi:ABC-type multidrug transport system ATPase subunit
MSGVFVWYSRSTIAGQFWRMPPIALSIRGLRKYFARGLARCVNRTLALDGVSVDLRQREILAVVGPEGAGKTTLLQCASGLLRPDAGSVIVSGNRLGSNGVAYVPPVPVYYPFLTVRDVLSLRASRCADAAKIDETLALFDLNSVRNEMIATLSSMELIRLSIAEAALSRPVALMFDTSPGPMPVDASSLHRALASLAATGIAVLAAVREERMAASVGAKALIMSEGRIAAPHSPQMFVAERLH